MRQLVRRREAKGGSHLASQTRKKDVVRLVRRYWRIAIVAEACGLCNADERRTDDLDDGRHRIGNDHDDDEDLGVEPQEGTSAPVEAAQSLPEGQIEGSRGSDGCDDDEEVLRADRESANLPAVNVARQFLHSPLPKRSSSGPGRGVLTNLNNEKVDDERPIVRSEAAPVADDLEGLGGPDASQQPSFSQVVMPSVTKEERARQTHAARRQEQREDPGTLEAREVRQVQQESEAIRDQGDDL